MSERPSRGLYKRRRLDYSTFYSTDSDQSDDSEVVNNLDGGDSDTESEADPEGEDEFEHGDEVDGDNDVEGADEAESDADSDGTADSDDIIGVLPRRLTDAPKLIGDGDRDNDAKPAFIGAFEHDTRNRVPCEDGDLLHWVSLPLQTAKVRSQPANQDAGSPDGVPSRFVSLSIKTSKTTSVRFAVTENAIRQIPEYAKKLGAAIAKNKSAHRLCISDPKFRKEESMFQVFEYLMHGILAPLNAEDRKGRVVAVEDIVDLYDLSVALHITTLQTAIVQHLDKSSTINLGTFVAFAIICFQDGEGHAATADCPLGVCIKQKLSTNLSKLIETNLIRPIKEAGGVLNKMLVEVFTENFLQRQKKQEGSLC